MVHRRSHHYAVGALSESQLRRSRRDEWYRNIARSKQPCIAESGANIPHAAHIAKSDAQPSDNMSATDHPQSELATSENQDVPLPIRIVSWADALEDEQASSLQTPHSDSPDSGSVPFSWEQYFAEEKSLGSVEPACSKPFAFSPAAVAFVPQETSGLEEPPPNPLSTAHIGQLYETIEMQKQYIAFMCGQLFAASVSLPHDSSMAPPAAPTQPKEHTHNREVSLQAGLGLLELSPPEIGVQTDLVKCVQVTEPHIVEECRSEPEQLPLEIENRNSSLEHNLDATLSQLTSGIREALATELEAKWLEFANSANLLISAENIAPLVKEITNEEWKGIDQRITSKCAEFVSTSFSNLVSSALPQVVEMAIQKINSTQQQMAPKDAEGATGTIPASPTVSDAEVCKTPATKDSQAATQPVPQKQAVVHTAKKVSFAGAPQHPHGSGEDTSDGEESPCISSVLDPAVGAVVHLQKLKAKTYNGKYGFISEELSQGRWAVLLLDSGKTINVHGKNLAALLPSEIKELDLNYWERTNLAKGKRALHQKQAPNFFNALDLDALSVDEERLMRLFTHSADFPANADVTDCM